MSLVPEANNALRMGPRMPKKLNAASNPSTCFPSFSINLFMAFPLPLVICLPTQQTSYGNRKRHHRLVAAMPRYDINWKQFMPRLGVVYRFTDRTVLRLGSGLFYSPQQTNNFNILGLNPPYSGSTVFSNDRNKPTAPIQNPLARTPAGRGADAPGGGGSLN